MWTSMRTEMEILENKDNELVDVADPSLMVYLKFNAMLSDPARVSPFPCPACLF